MFQKTHSRRRRSVRYGQAQALEDRCLLAVTVRASGTTATITGDGNANNVRLVGFGIAGFDGTQVDIDESFEDNQFDILTYKFDMKGGSDRVEVNAVFGTKLISIDGGNGANEIEIQNSSTKSLIIRNGSGRDEVLINRTQVGPDGQRNGGKVDIRNGTGGSNTVISSSGPGSGFSFHTNKVLIQNHGGGNFVGIADIRLREATVIVDNKGGCGLTRTKNVDRVKNIILRNKVSRDSGCEVLPSSGAIIEDTQVEFGGISLQASGTGIGSELTLMDGTTVKTKVLHKTSGVSRVTTTIDDSTVPGGVKAIHKKTANVELEVSESGVGKGVGMVSQFSGSGSKSTEIKFEDSFIDGNVVVKNKGTSSQAASTTQEVQIRNTLITGGTSMQLGDGGGLVQIVDGSFGNRFIFRGGQGSTAFGIEDSDFDSSVLIDVGGSGSNDQDAVFIERGTEGSSTSGTTIKGDLLINMGAGDDTVGAGGDGVLPENLLVVEGKAIIDGGDGLGDTFLNGNWATFDELDAIGFETP